MPETRVKVYQTTFDFNRDRDFAERNGWELTSATEEPDGTLKVWYRLTGKPRDTWADHPPEDFSWTRILAIVGGLTIAFVVGLFAVWLIF